MHLREMCQKAEMVFWTNVESNVEVLLEVPRSMDLSPWMELLMDAARDAYEQSCPRLTPRQIQAFAIGLRRLNAPPKSNQSTQTKGKAHE